MSAVLVASRYHVTDMYVKTLFHREEGSVTVSVVATVDAKDVAVVKLNFSIAKILNDNSSESPNVIDTFNDLEVTGYLPSCMLMLSIHMHVCTCMSTCLCSAVHL